MKTSYSSLQKPKINSLILVNLKRTIRLLIQTELKITTIKMSYQMWQNCVYKYFQSAVLFLFIYLEFGFSRQKLQS